MDRLETLTEDEKEEFAALCKHVLDQFNSVLEKESGEVHALDVLEMSKIDKTVAEKFVTFGAENIKEGKQNLLTILLSTFIMGVLFGQEARAFVGTKPVTH